MSWKDKQVEMFKVEFQDNKKCPVLLKTPLFDYGLSVEDFKKVRNAINDFKVE